MLWIDRIFVDNFSVVFAELLLIDIFIWLKQEEFLVDYVIINCFCGQSSMLTHHHVLTSIFIIFLFCSSIFYIKFQNRIVQVVSDQPNHEIHFGACNNRGNHQWWNGMAQFHERQRQEWQFRWTCFVQTLWSTQRTMVWPESWSFQSCGWPFLETGDELIAIACM